MVVYGLSFDRMRLRRVMSLAFLNGFCAFVSLMQVFFLVCMMLVFGWVEQGLCGLMQVMVLCGLMQVMVVQFMCLAFF